MTNHFKDKVVIITGASGGIGSALAKKLSKEGAKLSLVDLDEQALINVKNDLNMNDHDILLISADVTKEEQVKAYVDQTVDKFNRIDCFFNNAGVDGPNANIEDYSSESFKFVFDVNVNGTFYGLKYIMPVMKKQQFGSIVNTSSTAGYVGAPGFVGYNASKHAIIGITRVVSQEGAPYNVRVNAIAPAVINTNMMRNIEGNVQPGNSEEAKKNFESAIPLGRYGEVEEVANLAYFLLSDQSSFITQSIYSIDGGMTGQ